MSLTRKPAMTEKNRAAHQRNGPQSRGAATPEGKERSRAANLRHGIYSQLRDEALEALGEDPAELEALRAGAYDEFRPASDTQAWMVERVARLQWRMQRSERLQFDLLALRIQRTERRRCDLALHLRRQSEPVVAFLRRLREHATHPDFYAPPGYFRKLREVFEGRVEGSIGDLDTLLHQLRRPLDFGPALAGAAAATARDPDWNEDWEEWGADTFPLPRPAPAGESAGCGVTLSPKGARAEVLVDAV